MHINERNVGAAILYLHGEQFTNMGPARQPILASRATRRSSSRLADPGWMQRMHATLGNERTLHGLLMTDDERTVRMCLSVSPPAICSRGMWPVQGLLSMTSRLDEFYDHTYQGHQRKRLDTSTANRNHSKKSTPQYPRNHTEKRT